MKLLHTNKNVKDYPDSKVVRVSFECSLSPQGWIVCPSYQSLIKNLRKGLSGTWGYSNPTISSVTGMSEAYFFFQDEADLLVFILKLGNDHNIAFMWPKGIQFTVYEFCNE